MSLGDRTVPEDRSVMKTLMWDWYRKLKVSLLTSWELIGETFSELTLKKPNWLK